MNPEHVDALVAGFLALNDFDKGAFLRAFAQKADTGDLADLIDALPTKKRDLVLVLLIDALPTKKLERLLIYLRDLLAPSDDAEEKVLS
jgi:hypothetical protein